MKNGNNVYIVVDGYYSDYHIVAVFDNETAAEDFADATGCSVETHELNSVSPVPSGMKSYMVSCRNDEWEVSIEENWEAVAATRVYRLLFNSGFGFSTYCFARDEQHALKIGSERRAFMIATYGDTVDSEHNFGKEVAGETSQENPTSK